MTHVEAWLNGSYTTEELDSEMTDSEYRRYLQSSYWETWFCRWESVFYPEEPTKWVPKAKAEIYEASSVEGCTVEWDYGGFYTPTQKK